MQRYCLTLDLKNDPELIAEYERMHRKVWPEILQSIRDAGILQMEIYRVSNRLFMMMETTEDFSFAGKNEKERTNKKVQEWEARMWEYQQALPFAKPGEKWVLMEKIFDLRES